MKFKVLVGAGIAAAMMSTVSVAQASEWKIMPVLDDGWSPEFTLAYGGGILSGDDIDGDIAHGVQLSLDCPWFTPPEGVIPPAPPTPPLAPLSANPDSDRAEPPPPPPP